VSQPNRRALITGASAGIGRAFGMELARRGYDLVLVARRRQRLAQLAEEAKDEFGVTTQVIVADLAEPGAPMRIRAEADAPIDLLVNNAGFGTSKEFLDTSWTAHETFLRVMVHAPTELTHLLLPGMLERGSGHVLQIASLAALLPGAPGNTLYAAAKAFMLRFSESLAAELAGTGVGISVICPGLTHTEFHDVTQTRDDLSWAPESLWQSAEEVVAEALRAVERNEVVRVTGRSNRGVAWLMRHLPPTLSRSLLSQRR